MEFSERLKILREMRGWNQAQLARKTGCVPSLVLCWETGKRVPGYDSLHKLQKALGISWDALLGKP